MSNDTNPAKSSSEILNELFGTFNTSFDESEPSTPKSSYITKSHRHSTKEGDSPPAKKKSSEKSKVKGEKSSKEKKKDKSKSKDLVLADGVSSNNAKEKNNNSGKNGQVAGSSSQNEGIGKDQKTGNQKPGQSSAEILNELFGTFNTSFDEQAEKISPAHSSHRHKKKKRSRSVSQKKRSRSPSQKKRSPSPSERKRKRSSSPSPKRCKDKSNFKEKDRNDYRERRERERSKPREDKYYSSSDRRMSAYDYDYDYRSYNGNRGGFGYDGSRGYSRNEDDCYYDYRRRDDHRESGRYSRRSRSNSRSRTRSSSYRERSTLRRIHPDDIIDKAVLLEIARKNAAKLMRQGVLPTDIFSRDQILAIKAGGKSVEELTEYCKRIAKRDALGDADGSSDDERLINHPFNVKDRPLPAITMNIRNAIPLPIRSSHELAIENAKLKVQFPVSSGTQHRYKELEWKSIDDDKVEKKGEDLSKALVPLSTPKVGTIVPYVHDAPGGDSEGKSKEMEITLEPKPATSVDIGNVISKRLRAMKELQTNPDDIEAKDRFDAATAEMKEWAEAKALEPKFLTPAELLTGPQAWAKKDQLKTASAVQGGMGMHLLQRMGWNPGEGLGKNKEGTTEPLALDIKTDKKGLASSGDLKGPSLPNVFDLSGKHPVSSLMELCAKRRWGDPTFSLCFEHGPSHKRQFVYKVTVNGVEYQPCVASAIKKDAKANAAAFCLQSLGLLPTPKTSPATAKPATLLKTVPDAEKSSPKPADAGQLLMPPPPPPPPPEKIVKKENPPLPPPPPPPLIPPPLPPPSLLLVNPYEQPQFQARPRNLMERKLMNLAGMSIPAGSMPALPPEFSYDDAGLLRSAPIVQVPLPSSSLQGFPGLTTF